MYLSRNRFGSIGATPAVMTTTAAVEAQKQPKLVNIAPVPPGDTRTTGHTASDCVSEPAMPYACQACAKRKVKCNKVSPVCSSCRRGKLECKYQQPPPRSRKRKPDDNVLEKLARYERVLQQHGLLEAVASNIPSTASPQNSIPIHPKEQEIPQEGKLLASQGKSRYVDGGLWQTIGEDHLQHVSDHEDGEESASEVGDSSTSDPLTEAFLDSYQSLTQYHPSHEKALSLWCTYAENVEPIYKILHVPSMDRMVRTVSKEPENASKADECLLFAIYHFSVFSLDEDDCIATQGQPRSLLMQRYHLATRKALANASFLKTTEMIILQALVLFLIPCRFSYDPHTYWVLTGVATRIAQRMGLHRDGEKFGLPPFEVQMKRRLFYQILPLDGIAAQSSGAGMSVTAPAWDTQLPLNINDDQIWPGMTDNPQAKDGATDMVFCLSRSTVGTVLFKFGGIAKNNIEDREEAERAINDAESDIEQKFIRYCDITNPLHFLAVGLARSGITTLRIKIRLSKIKDQTATDAERKELLGLAYSILDTDAAAFSNNNLMRFQWYIKPFFLWGMWVSFILLLTNLWKRRDLFSPTEAITAWKRVETVYKDHEELLEKRRALYKAFGRLAVRAWDAGQEGDVVPEPAFITALRLPRKSTPSNPTSQAKRQENAAPGALGDEPSVPTPSSGSLSDLNMDVSPGTSLDSIDLGLDAGDWAWWDQLMQDYQELDKN